MSDGVALCSTAHPRSNPVRWWLWGRWRRPRLSPHALEEISILIRQERRCHYCASLQDNTELLVHHDGVCICNECVD
jgi:hypothetical protein